MSQLAVGIKRGDWYAFCQVCGRRFFGSTLHTRWDGLYVCTDDFEPKNPVLSPIIIKDTRNPPRVSTMDLSNTLLATPISIDNDPYNWYNNGEGNIV